MCVIGATAVNTFGCGLLMSHEEIAEQRLEERYGMPFEIVDTLGGGILDEYFTVIAYQKDNPQTPFRATVNNDGSGESDNYVCKLVCQKISDRITQNLDNLNGACYVYTAFLVDPPNLTDVDMTVEEYMMMYPNDTYHVYLNYCPDQIGSAAFCESLSGMFEGLEGLSGRIYLYAVNERILNNVQEYLGEHDKMYDDYFHIVEPYDVGIIPFENGKIQLTDSEIEAMIG